MGMDTLSRFLVQQPLHILGVAGMFFLLWAFLKPRGRALLVPAFAWLAYAAWEWSILIFTPEANIRVDMLIVLPLLALVTLWPVFKMLFWALKLIFRRRNDKHYD
jgi:hypothetical protein